MAIVGLNGTRNEWEKLPFAETRTGAAARAATKKLQRHGRRRPAAGYPKTGTDVKAAGIQFGNDFHPNELDGQRAPNPFNFTTEFPDFARETKLDDAHRVERLNILRELRAKVDNNAKVNGELCSLVAEHL